MSKQPYLLEQSLGYIMGRAARSLGQRLTRNFTCAGYEVTCEQWAILVYLGQKNGQNQQDLSAQTCKDKTSMVRLIDGMEKRNLVVRIPDKTDKRQKMIYLTAKGKEFRKKLEGIVQKTIEEAEVGIKPQDMAFCKYILQKIYGNLAECKPKITVAHATKKIT